MPHARFEVALVPRDAVLATGAESVRFTAALNAGDEPRALDRVASGGELARVMLSLSTALSEAQEIGTLVFDEVDAGVGGAVAWQVGALLRRVAVHHQVLAISHVAQIAACASQHMVVVKTERGEVTTSGTAVVTGEARITEIARMLSGDDTRDVSRAHARELLERGQGILERPPSRRRA
jgi:DNA repair protein RecN (Recombination protein N)